jgi:hypothetical protein
MRAHRELVSALVPDIAISVIALLHALLVLELGVPEAYL